MDITTAVHAAWSAGSDIDQPAEHLNFFEQGGDSLAALRIVNRLTDGGLPLSLAEFYTNPTMAQQISLLESQRAADPPSAAPDTRRSLPVTPLQPVLMLESLRYPDSDSYWMVNCYEFPGRVDGPRARQAWLFTVARNPALRTRILTGTDGMRQVIEDSSTDDAFRHLDDLVLEAGQTLPDWCRRQVESLRTPGVDRLVSGWFVSALHDPSRAEPRSVFLLAVHHVLVDGWSLVQCLEDFAAALSGRADLAAGPRPSAAAYLDWCDGTGARQRAAAYWRERLAGIGPGQPLDFALSADADARAISRMMRLDLTGGASETLRRFCARRGVTPASVVAYMWSRVLAQYQPDARIRVGITVNIRPGRLREASRLSGCLINVVPLLFGETSGGLDEETASAMRQIVAAAENGHLAYPDLCEAAGLPRNAELFTSTVVFENYQGDLESIGSNAGDDAPRRVHHSGGSADPLCLTVRFGAPTEVYIEWDASRYDDTVVRAIGRAVVYWMSHPEDAVRAAATSNWLTPDERPLATLGSPAEPRPWRIGRHLGTAPGDAVAVEDEAESLSYAELRRCAQRMARHLSVGHGLEPGDRVAFVGERGVPAAVAICGAWLAGLTWFAVDEHQPPARRRRLLESVRARAVVRLDEDEWRSAAGDGVGFDETLPAEAPAYLVATSGSTGEPKIAALAAGGLEPLIDAWRREYAPDGRRLRVLQLGSWSGDVFLGDLLKALSTGGTLVICPDRHRVDMSHVAGLIDEKSLNLAESTPSLIGALLRHCARYARPLRSLSTVIVGADVFRVRELERLRRDRRPGLRVVNGYGLSECTIESLVFDADDPMGFARSGLCPVGVPLPGTALSIVDREGNPLPRGALGELRITGPGVTLGYVGDAGDPEGGGEGGPEGGGEVGGEVGPEGGGEGGRGFRTGDYGLIDARGSVQFYGRRDAQVKIRGHRVELGEVENALLALSGVDEAHVRAHGSSLRAFVGSGTADPDSLAERLRDVLPEHAVPRFIEVMERLPRNENGKIDRTALADRALPASPCPVARVSMMDGTAGAIAETAGAIAEIWTDLLGVEVPPDRTFFDAGGDSIQVITLHERLQERFPGVTLTVGDLFRYPTVAGLARHLGADGADTPHADRMAILRAVSTGELSAVEGLRLIEERST